MRWFLMLCLLLGACAGSQPAAKTPDDQGSFANRTRERWEREEGQRAVESRRNQFTSNSAQRGDVQAQP